MRGLRVSGFQSRLAQARPQLPTVSPACIRSGLSSRRHQTTSAAEIIEAITGVKQSAGANAVPVAKAKPRRAPPVSLNPVSLNPYSVEVTLSKEGVSIEVEDWPQMKRKLLPSLWLRDNCRCSKCVNQDTMQRNFDTFQIPLDIHPKGYAKTKLDLHITWSDEHVSRYPFEFIQHYLSNDYRKLDVRKDPETLHYANAMHSMERPPRVSYGAVMRHDDSGVADLTSKIRNWGFAIVYDVPYDSPHYTRWVLKRIAFIRVTHYGGFYDFTPDLAMADTAYTNLALAAHTDTTYFTDPAGLQAFHLLSHTAAQDTDEFAPEPPEPVEGGKSLLVDGFRAAWLLKHEDPAAYEILSKVRLPWHASGNKGITIAPDKRYPVIELDEDTGETRRIRWNNDDRGVVPWDAGYSPDQWYEAARKWNEILRRKDSEIWYQLTPGNVLIFDNWRVLHGRQAFTGIRRICGGYINRDDFMSRWRNTNLPREELSKVVG